MVRQYFVGSGVTRFGSIAFNEYIGQRDLSPGTTASVSFEKGTRFEVLPNKRLIIGRGRTAEIVILSNRLSRAHAAVFMLNDERLVVVDLKTTNGTCVDKEARAISFLSSGREFWVADLFGFRYLS